MMNALQDKLKSLSMVVGPLGPMVSLDERERDQANWRDRQSVEDLPLLVEILKLSATESSDDLIDVEEAKQLVTAALALLATAHPALILSALATLLPHPIAEIQVYLVLQEWGDPRAIPLLAAAVAQTEDADLAIEIPCALGINRDEQRVALLHRLAERFPSEVGLQHEVRIALWQV
jgi:hypothetical protein